MAHQTSKTVQKQPTPPFIGRLTDADFYVHTTISLSPFGAFLAAPNPDTEQGQKDHALLLFLYNSGAKARKNCGTATRVR